MLRSEIPSSAWDVTPRGLRSPYDTSRYPFASAYPFTTIPEIGGLVEDLFAPVEQILGAETAFPSQLSPYGPRRRGRSFYPEEVTATTASQLRPHMDVYELSDSYYYSFEMPGISKKEDVDLGVENNILRVRAQKPEIIESASDPVTTWGGAERSKSGDFHRRERPYGMYRRAVRLPSNADPNKISCSYDNNGLLTVRINKIGEASQGSLRKIQIA